MVNANFNLDNLSTQEIKRLKPKLRATFKLYTALALLSHLIVTGLTVAYIAIWWETGYVGVLFARILVIPRIILLLRVLTIRIDVIAIMGVGKYYKIMRYFSHHPALGAWLLIGFVDLYLIRWKIPFLNLLHFTIKGPVDTFQFPAYLILDLLYFIDFYVTVYIVYYVAVRRNIARHLRLKKKRRPITTHHRV